MNNEKNFVYRKRLFAHRAGIAMSVIAMAIGIGLLTWILATLFHNGFAALSRTLFTHDIMPPGDPGGLRNSIVGSLLMVGLSTIVSTPIGILAGIYLAEYGDDNKFAQVTRFVTDVMLSAPSIVIALFVAEIYVANVKHYSGYAGSLAMSLIAMPVVVRSTDNILRLVPNSLLEAAYALGTPRWKVAILVRARAVKAGILTGVLLAVARIAGETAPMLFTAFGNQFFSTDMNAPLSSLPQVIYLYGMSAYEDWRSLAWGGALVLTFAVLLLNILSRVMFSQKTPR